MSANILPFETQGDRQLRLAAEAQQPPVDKPEETAAERELRYYGFTLDTVRKLVKYYQRTGQWTAACDAPIAEAVMKLRYFFKDTATTKIERKEPAHESQDPR